MHLPPLSLDDCAARCKSSCPNCHYVSLSHAHHTCTWFASCDLSMLRTDFGGGTYRTRRVRPGNAFPDPPPGLQCDVSLRKQISSMPCKSGVNYGCYDAGAGEAGRMWAVRGCRGLFRLDGAELGCGSQLDGRLRNCSTAAAGARASHRRRNGTAHARRLRKRPTLAWLPG